MQRRDFLKTAGAGLMAGLGGTAYGARGQADRPNILWLTVEDMGPHLGCYGDSFAQTPNIDAFAERSLRYRHCWSNAPVCAPARTTLITGMYPPCIGAEHMRSYVPFPSRFRVYPQYLRDAGYYCTNNKKEDFNVETHGPVWDEVSNDAHWKDAPEGQPFFAIFNFTGTHESRIRTRPHEAVSDPAEVPVPPYHPDTPEVRQDWAQYYDNIMKLDEWVASHLQALEDAGLAENTIVFFYADHGSGMPRHKRWLYESGLHVPLIVHVPQAWRSLAPREYDAGAWSDRLVSFVDFAPTAISLAGHEPPAHFQGHAFMGPHAAPPQDYIYGFRGRMDERIDLSRAVRNERFSYIRNYMPHKPCGQYLNYMFQTPATETWKAMYDAGELNADQRRFWEPKAPEELYGLEADPHQLTNLVDSPDHRAALEELRTAHREWEFAIRDVALLPESMMHARSEGTTPYAMGQNPETYDFEAVWTMAHEASLITKDNTPMMVSALAHDDNAVRYWAAMGLLMRGRAGVEAAHDELRTLATEDPAHAVRVAAAEALALHGNDDDTELALTQLVADANAKEHGYFAVLPALNALDLMDERAASAADALAGYVEDESLAPQRLSPYITRLVEKTLAGLKAGS